MKILWSWLLELCDLDRVPTVDEGARALTRGGLEIESMTNLGAGFTGVIVAEVVAKRPHPQADKLTLVDVITDRGGTATTVVCGAANVPEPGGKVLWAQIGATLPGGITLSPKPVKGIVSPGMLCAEDELGLGDDHAGIIVLEAGDRTPLGAPAQRALFVDDWVLEVKAPANRGDVLGHLGVARELACILRGKLVLPDVDLGAYQGPGTMMTTVEIVDPDACPRYLARELAGLAVRPSPRRIAQRLRSVGVRPISNLVDATNYVMFELGQPLHAFDAATLTTGVIRVGHAGDGEKFATLDGTERTLVPGDLVIRDGARAIALAGVMGGRDSEVTATTTRVLLESASFAPLLVRRTARRLGLHSEASHRYERGVDPELAALASARAARLLCEHGGGHVVGEAVDAYPKRRTVQPIRVRLDRVATITGVPLDAATCTDALERLGCAVTAEFATPITGPGNDPQVPIALAVTPPSVRTDVAREIDVIEEIIRIHGYEVVPSTLPVLRVAPGVRPADRADVVRVALAAAGLDEAITYAFQSVARNASLGLAAGDRRSQPIAIRNPMSADQAVMRTSLLPNLLGAVARNQSFGRPDVALFEVGNVFLRRGESVSEAPPHELADEPIWAAGILAGRRPGHLGHGAPWDALDAKGFALLAIRAVAGELVVRVRAAKVAYLHPGITGELVEVGHDDATLGWFGEVHPAVRARLGVDGPCFAFEVELSHLRQRGPAQMRAIPRFPGSARDVSLLVGEAIPAARVEAVIAAVADPLVDSVRLLEDYRDPKLPPGTKSMLWSIGYRALDRTLTDVEIEKAHEAIAARLVVDVPATRR